MKIFYVEGDIKDGYNWKAANQELIDKNRGLKLSLL